MPEESALIVPVGEAETVVRDPRARYDPAAQAGIPAHITILYPFKPPEAIKGSDLDDLRELFGSVRAFSFALTSVAQFPDVLYLVPDPGEPFVRMTAAVATRWPESPPYGGRYDQIIPHLTVAHTQEPEVIAELRADLIPFLPISCRARQARLLTSTGSGWSITAEFPFARVPG